MKKFVSAFAGAVIMCLVSIGYANAADIKKGKKVFNKCKGLSFARRNKTGSAPASTVFSAARRNHPKI